MPGSSRRDAVDRLRAMLASDPGFEVWPHLHQVGPLADPTRQGRLKPADSRGPESAWIRPGAPPLLHGQRERPSGFLLRASGLLCTRQDSNLQPSDP